MQSICVHEAQFLTNASIDDILTFWYDCRPKSKRFSLPMVQTRSQAFGTIADRTASQ